MTELWVHGGALASWEVAGSIPNSTVCRPSGNCHVPEVGGPNGEMALKRGSVEQNFFFSLLSLRPCQIKKEKKRGETRPSRPTMGHWSINQIKHFQGRE